MDRKVSYSLRPNSDVRIRRNLFIYNKILTTHLLDCNVYVQARKERGLLI